MHEGDHRRQGEGKAPEKTSTKDAYAPDNQKAPEPLA